MKSRALLLSTGRRAALWIVAALVAGCAALAPAPPQEVVKQRAQARWEALIAGDLDKAYSYMAPSYRALIDRKRYTSQFGGGASWESVNVVKVDCPQEDRCTALIRIGFKPVIGARLGQPMSTHYEETWIREDGQWWMFQKV